MDIKDISLLILIVVIAVLIIFDPRGCREKEYISYTDTVRVSARETLKTVEVKYKYLPAKLCTVTVHDSTSPTEIQTEIASVDTILGSDTLAVRYFFPPLNYFDLNLTHRYTDTIYSPVLIYKEVVKDDPWFYKPALFLGGAGIVAIINAVKH